MNRKAPVSSSVVFIRTAFTILQVDIGQPVILWPSLPETFLTLPSISYYMPLMFHIFSHVSVPLVARGFTCATIYLILHASYVSSVLSYESVPRGSLGIQGSLSVLWLPEAFLALPSISYYTPLMFAQNGGRYKSTSKKSKEYYLCFKLVFVFILQIQSSLYFTICLHVHFSHSTISLQELCFWLKPPQNIQHFESRAEGG